MSTLLYKQNRIENKPSLDIEIQKFTPSIFRVFLKGEKRSLKNLFARLYFRLMAGKKYVIYYVLSPEGKISHTSTVMPKCFKFRYLGKADCEIGPCYTMSEFRGKGIYPKVLRFILSDYKADAFYMTVSDNNTPSIRGIEKAEFESYGKIKKSKLFKVYRLAEEETK